MISINTLNKQKTILENSTLLNVNFESTSDSLSPISNNANDLNKDSYFI